MPTGRASVLIDCRWVVPPAQELATRKVVRAHAACPACFVEADIDVSVHTPQAGRGMALALQALKRELGALGCQHEMPAVIAGRELLPAHWFP
jgi:hypothetical protein